MNGSAQKMRRWTKGGSLSRSVGATAPQLCAHHSDSAGNTTVPALLRNVIAELLASERYFQSGTGPARATRSSSQMPSGNPVSSTPAAVDVEPAKTNESAPRLPLWKRMFDLTVVFASLPLWLPLMMLVMIVVKIGSPGPVFYRQERVGYRRKLFMIFKFRSMEVDAETGSHERHLATLIGDNSPMTKLDAAGDPRLIPLGRFLRATGLDELPQLFNVIRGEMSLVGPRPCLPYEFQRYAAWQQERVNAAPGLTGYWQVNGKNKTTFAEMIDMDIFYSKNMSLWFDLAIIFKTVPAIIQQVLEAQIHSRIQSVVSPSVRRGSSTLTT